MVHSNTLFTIHLSLYIIHLAGNEPEKTITSIRLCQISSDTNFQQLSTLTESKFIPVT